MLLIYYVVGKKYFADDNSLDHYIAQFDSEAEAQEYLDKLVVDLKTDGRV